MYAYITWNLHICVCWLLCKTIYSSLFKTLFLKRTLAYVLIFFGVGKKKVTTLWLTLPQFNI